MGRPTSNSDSSTFETKQLVLRLIHLIQSSLSQNTAKSYEKSLQSFFSFLQLYHLPVQFPIMPISVALYATFMENKGYASSSIASALSVISFVHKCKGFPEPGKSFIVQQTLKGIKKSNPSMDCRLPITVDLLYKLCDSLCFICSARTRSMLKSMYLMAFYAFLRVGEFTLSHDRAENVLQLSDVIFDTVQSVSIIFNHYKYSNGKKACIKIYSQKDPYCPVQSLKEYMYFRGQTEGPLYIMPNGKMVTRQWFVNNLNKSLQFLKLDTVLYKSHSFRIGAASYAAIQGMSDSQIRYMGRWNSDAFRKYIRLG